MSFYAGQATFQDGQKLYDSNAQMNKTVIAGEHGLGDSKPGGLSRVGFCSNLSMSVATATDSMEHEQVVSYEQEHQRLIASNAANSVKKGFTKRWKAVREDFTKILSHV